jgi:sterol desaturase/sphingolipid hydroxylase (fatty acid hydroxylase superfamily)
VAIAISNSGRATDAHSGHTDNRAVATVARYGLPYIFLFVLPGLGVAAALHGPKLAVLGVYVSVEAFILLAERLIPFQFVPGYGEARNRKADLLYLVTSPIMFFGIQVGVLPGLEAARHLLIGNGHLWVTSAPFPVQVVLTLVLQELAYYGAHRFSHRDNIFWRAHRIHHSAEGIDWLMNWRIHWLNELMHLVARFVPLVLLGVPPQVVAVTMVIVNTHSMFPHTNADIRAGRVINLVFNTPELHRWHHLRDISLAQTNFCGTTVIWDHVFRTYRAPAITNDTPFGVPPNEMAEVPDAWARQLGSVFRRRITPSLGEPAGATGGI